MIALAPIEIVEPDEDLDEMENILSMFAEAVLCGDSEYRDSAFEIAVCPVCGRTPYSINEPGEIVKLVFCEHWIKEINRAFPQFVGVQGGDSSTPDLLMSVAIYQEKESHTDD